MIILVTRNPLIKLAPDLCSRITLVNFTVTPASLEAQALSAILKEEGFDSGRPSFVVWEGVAMYLTPTALEASMATLSSLCPRGSELAMTYVTGMGGLSVFHPRRMLFNMWLRYYCGEPFASADQSIC